MSTQAEFRPRFLAEGAMGAFLAALARRHDLQYPAPTEGSFVLRRHDAGEEAPAFAWNPVRLPESPKGLFFPPAKIVARWGKSGPGPGPDVRSRAVVGAKACDLHALQIIDRVFADHEFRESYWCAARAATFLVSGDCSDCLDSCFCTLVGERPWPTSGYDLNLSPADGGYVVDVGSASGAAFVAGHEEFLGLATARKVTARDRGREDLETRIRERNAEFRTRETWRSLVAKNARTRVWGELSATCVECSACNHVCPTCHCFLLVDATDADGAARISVWDSCFMAGHARMAGGGTPRLQLTERFRNHYVHKFESFPANWGVTACSGCGRCIAACMGRIDKRDCLKKLETRWIPSEAEGELR